LGTLYENIITLCEEKGIKGGKMCTDIGMSKGILTDLKMGRQMGISAANAQKIASYFGVSVGYRLGTDDEKTPPAKAESVQYTDMELLEAFRSADERTRDAIRTLLGIKEGK
jgi:transcriptional regulator with XRE-family HTH domain